MNDKLDLYDEPSKDEQNVNISPSTCTSTVDIAAENQHDPHPHEREGIVKSFNFNHQQVNELSGLTEDVECPPDVEEKVNLEQEEDDPSEQYEVVDKMKEKKIVHKFLPKNDEKVLNPSEYVQASDKRGNSSENISKDDQDEEDPLQAVKYSSDILDDILEEPEDKPEILEEPKDKLDILEEPKGKFNILEDILKRTKDIFDILEDFLKRPNDKLDVLKEHKDKLDVLKEPKDDLSGKLHQTKSEKKGTQYCSCIMIFFYCLCVGYFFGAGVKNCCLDLRSSLQAYVPLSRVEVCVNVVGFHGPTVLPPNLTADREVLPSPDLPGYNVRVAGNINITRNPTGASRIEVPPVERAADHRREGDDRTEELRMFCMPGDDRAGQVEVTRQEGNHSNLPEEDEETKQLRLALQNILTVEEQYRQQIPNTGTQSQAESDRLLNEEIMGRQTILMPDGQQSTVHTTTTDTVQGRERSPGDNTRHNTESSLSSWLFNTTQFSVSPDVQEEMLEHSARANTFGHKWPHHFLSGEQMAHAGLYFTGQNDVTRCPFCGICIDRWQEGDDPLQEHRKLSQECIFAYTQLELVTPRNRGREVGQKRDSAVGPGSQPDTDAEGATANCAAEGALKHKIEKKEADDPGNKNPTNNRGIRPYGEAVNRISRIQQQNGRYLNPELNSVFCEEERAGVHQLRSSDARSREAATRERARSHRQSMNSDQTTQEIAWQEEAGGAQFTLRAQRNVLDEESHELAGITGNDERAGAHQLGRSSRKTATRERGRSYRQAGVNSDQTTQGIAWQEEPGGAQSTDRSQRNVLDEESHEFAGSHSLSERTEQFLHSSDGRQLISEGYSRQHMACAIGEYLFSQRITGDNPINIGIARLALQSLSARPKRKDKEEMS